MKEFNTLLHQTISRLFLVVWPPFAEDSALAIDMSMGFVFTQDPNCLCIVSTDTNNLCMPCLKYEMLPDVILPWPSFYFRMEQWMTGVEEADLNRESDKFTAAEAFAKPRVLDTEYYEVTNVDLFVGIVAHPIRSIEFIRMQNTAVPFGVKLMFDKDYVLSSPINDGNTIETAYFNNNANILNFERIGSITYDAITG